MLNVQYDPPKSYDKCYLLHEFYVPEQLTDNGDIPDGTLCLCGKLTHERSMTEAYMHLEHLPRSITTEVPV